MHPEQLRHMLHSMYRTSSGQHLTLRNAQFGQVFMEVLASCNTYALIVSNELPMEIYGSVLRNLSLSPKILLTGKRYPEWVPATVECQFTNEKLNQFMVLDRGQRTCSYLLETKSARLPLRDKLWKMVQIWR